MNSNVIDRTPNLTKQYNRIDSIRGLLNYSFAAIEVMRETELRLMAHELGLQFADEIAPEPMPLIEPEIVVTVRGKSLKVGKPAKVAQLSMFDSELNPVVETVQFNGSNWDEYFDDLFARLDANGNLSDEVIEDVSDLMVDDSAEVAQAAVVGVSAIQKAAIGAIFAFVVILISVLA